MYRRWINAAAAAMLFLLPNPLRADDPVPPAAFNPDVDPALIPRRPDMKIVDDAEIRLVTPFIFTDKFAGETRLWIDGWIAQSYNFNPYQPPRHSNGPVGFIDRGNEYRLNQYYLRVGRSLDNTRDRFDFGGQADVLYGSDAEFVQAFGLDQKIILDNEFYRMAVPQAYVSAYVPIANGLTLTAGKFYTPFGLDNPTAIGGFFPTKPYSLIYSPFTLTGGLASMTFAENWTVAGGVFRGWDQWTDANNGLSGLVSFAWKSPCEHTKFAVSLLAGPEQDEPRAVFNNVVVPGGQSAMRWLVCSTVEHQLSQKWRLAVEGDYGLQQDANAAGDAAWYGVTSILRYEYDDCYSFGLRGEWFRDDDGFRVNPARTSQPIQVWTGTPSDYFTASLGAQVRMNQWITVRPEIRIDWQLRDDPAAPRAFDGGLKGQQVLGVLDVVLRF